MTTTADMFETTRIALDNPAAVIATRDFAAPPKTVWRAVTDPALVTCWMGAMPGWTMTVCEMDVREGGAFRWFWEEDESGKGFGFFGTYREVSAPHRLVNTETFDPGTLGGEMATSVVTMTLEPCARGTRMVSRIDYGSPAEREAALATGMTDGMEISYSGLDRVLSAV